MKNFRGTSLTDHALTAGEVLVTTWQVKSAYHWDAGLAMSRYLEGLKAGMIKGVRCRQCRRTMVPPRAFCELCFRPIDEWVDLPDTGKINTFSVSFVNWDASRRQTPEIPVVVEIDAASPGMCILHKMGEVGETLEEVRSRLRLGAPVQAVWKPAGQREGSITDIEYFRPVD